MKRSRKIRNREEVQHVGKLGLKMFANHKKVIRNLLMHVVEERCQDGPDQ